MSQDRIFRAYMAVWEAWERIRRHTPECPLVAALADAVELLESMRRPEVSFGNRPVPDSITEDPES